MLEFPIIFFSFYEVLNIAIIMTQCSYILANSVMFIIAIANFFCKSEKTYSYFFPNFVNIIFLNVY